ncbi:hypothetical protein ACN38_g12273 [Penicillium nordicum]|uniref:Uncharacterized protein n=1 Tax=Penicillium nordicum TaxID=229535 RepID=A0A0M8NPW2_9EURO|nr:hypothetical protein ACN38_g12273 [Penicillium nordicum]
MYTKRFFEFIIKNSKDVPSFFGALPQWGAFIVGIASVWISKEDLAFKKEEIAQGKSSNTVQPRTLDHARRDHQNEAASEHPRRAATEPEYESEMNLK